MSSNQALATLIVLTNAENAFRSTNPDQRERGWALLEEAEKQIPNIEDQRLFRRAQRHADRVWSLACVESAVTVNRQTRAVSYVQVSVGGVRGVA